MELNELEAKLEELGKILLADDGFFTQMPKEQFDAFGKAITLMARIEATKVLQENKSNMICDMPMMEYRKCPNCASEPCMCAINAHQEPMVDKPEDMSGDMPMDKPEDVK